jgi:hypothetical protein
VSLRKMKLLKKEGLESETKKAPPFLKGLFNLS